MCPRVTSFILLFGVFEVPTVRGLLPFEEYDIRLKGIQDRSYGLHFDKIAGSGTKISSHISNSTASPRAGITRLCDSHYESWIDWETLKERFKTGPRMPQDRLTVGPDPLTSERLSRAWFNRGDTTRLDRFLRRLDSRGNESIKIAVLGGSMTDGHDTETPWFTHFIGNLRRAYPGAPPIRFWNLGVGGSSSFGGLENVLPIISSIPDFDGIALVIVDYGVNDAHIRDHQNAAATEGLVNAIMSLPSEPALIYLDTFRTVHGQSDGDQFCDSLKFEGSWLLEKHYCSHMYRVQDVHALVTVPANVPHVSYRNVAWPIFEETSPLKENNNALWQREMHPFEVTHALVANVFFFALQERANELCLEHQGHIIVQHEEPSTVDRITRARTCNNIRRQRQLLSNEGISRRLFFHRGNGPSSKLLDDFLARITLCKRPVLIAVAVGGQGELPGNATHWPKYFNDGVAAAYGTGCASVQYVVPTARGLELQEPRFTFESSKHLADHLKKGQNQQLSRADLVIVEMAASDGKHLSNMSASIHATQTIVSSVTALTPRPALLYFDTFYRAASPMEAEADCGSYHPIRADPNLCPNYYHAGINHNQVTVPRGIPVVSYCYGMWPILSQPPGENLMDKLGFQQTDAVHKKIANFLLQALHRRSVEVFKCSGENSRGASSMFHRVEFFKSEEAREGLCPSAQDAYALSPFTHTIQGGGLMENAIFSHGNFGWKFYEDVEGKPGWIYENGNASISVLSFSVPYYAARGHFPSPEMFRSYNIGYLRSYGCFGKVQIWTGSIDPWDPQTLLLHPPVTPESCGLVLDGHWNDTVSLFVTHAFRPQNFCGHTKVPTEKNPRVLLNIRPIAGSDVGIPGCTQGQGKFKVDFIETCDLTKTG